MRQMFLAGVITLVFALGGAALAQTTTSASFDQTKKVTKDKLWDALKSGQAVALMRHSIAPGTGDPKEFKLGDCKTQRNLSDEGKKQAKAIGDIFRARGITSAVVFTSAWCRTRETAALLNIGDVSVFPPLNSFYANPKAKPFQTEKIRRFVLRARGKATKVLVTHQVNISALTGKFAKSGEIIVVEPTKDNKIKVLGAL